MADASRNGTATGPRDAAATDRAQAGPVRAALTDHIAGRLSDDEAQAIYEAVETRRRALKRPVQGHSPVRVVVVREEAERPPVTNVEPRRTARSGPRQLTLRIPRPATYDRT